MNSGNLEINFVTGQINSRIEQKLRCSNELFPEIQKSCHPLISRHIIWFFSFGLFAFLFWALRSIIYFFYCISYPEAGLWDNQALNYSKRSVHYIASQISIDGSRAERERKEKREKKRKKEKMKSIGMLKCNKKIKESGRLWMMILDQLALLGKMVNRKWALDKTLMIWEPLLRDMKMSENDY